MELSTLLTIPSGIFIGIGAIIASFITGLITYTNIIISKETTISNFKQQWVDELRDDISSFLSLINSLTNIVYKEQKSKKDKKLTAKDDLRILSETRDLYVKMDALYRKILMRLNSNNHNKLETEINKLYLLFHDGRKRTPKEIYYLSNKITNTTKKIIEDEWYILKEGETSFKITKKIISISITLSFILITIYILYVFKRM